MDLLVAKIGAQWGTFMFSFSSLLLGLVEQCHDLLANHSSYSERYDSSSTMMSNACMMIRHVIAETFSYSLKHLMIL